MCIVCVCVCLQQLLSVVGRFLPARTEVYSEETQRLLINALPCRAFETDLGSLDSFKGSGVIGGEGGRQ